MKRPWLLCLFLLCVVVAPVLAVQYGGRDEGEHPYVGLLVFYDADGNPMWLCSGTLLTPTVVLTAAHCTSGTASARVWFDELEEDIIADGFPGSGGTTGTPYTHPKWDDFASFPATYDVGVVELDTGVTMSTYGVLCDLGELNSLNKQKGQQNTIFDVTGYGLQSVKPKVSAELSRFKGSVKITNLKSALTDGWNIQATESPGKGNGQGGTCFGDSGGPMLVEDSNVVVGITSFGKNYNCKGVGYYFRADIKATQDFVKSFLD